MAASLISSLRVKAEKEGVCPKMASSKGKDEIRGKWDDRFFQLKGYQLFYYKKQTDNKPKGEIDLRDAKIDAADDFKTGRPNCIRIAQAKQVFNYFQAKNTKDRDEWILLCRIAAGYDNPHDEIDPHKNKEINDQSESHCSFGVLLVDAKNAEHPERVVITLDPSGTIRIIKDEDVKKSYDVSQLDNVTCSEKTELRLVDSFGIHELWSMTLDFRDAGSAARHKFYVGSADETKDLVQLMRQFKTKNMGVVKSTCTSGTIQSRYVEVGDYTQTGKWEQRWAVLKEKKVVLFKSELSRKAIWALYVQPANIKRDGKVGVCIKTGIETALIKFDTEKDRNEWFKNLESVAQTLKDKIEKEVKSEPVEKKKIEKTPAPSTPAPLDDIEINFPVASDLSRGESSFLASWGEGTSGQLGSREKNSLLDPHLVEALRNKNLRSISAGDAHAGAVTESGHLYMWGAGSEMQLGLGERMTESKSPYLVTSLIKNYVIMNVSCGKHHTLAVTSKGQIFSWGSNAKGQLGLGSVKTAAYPTEIPKLQGQAVTYISAGSEHSACIVGDQGELYTWGCNGSGCLGTGSIKVSSEPQSNILSKKGKITMVECGTDFTAAIVGGKLYTWGANDFGQLGLADKEPRQVPTEVQYFKDQDVKVVQVACGGTHMLALCSKSKKTSLYAWGASVVNGFREPQVLPTRVTAIDNVRYIACSSTHTVVINDESQLFSFGFNRSGELGNGQAGVQATVKVRLTESIKVVKAMCGKGFTLALCAGDPPESGITPAPTAAYVRGQATAKETGQIRSELGIQQGKDKRNLLNIDDTNEMIARVLAVEHQRNNGKFREDPNDAPLKDRHVDAITTLLDLDKMGGFGGDLNKPQVPAYNLGSVQGTATKFKQEPTTIKSTSTASDIRLKSILADMTRKERGDEEEISLPPPPEEDQTPKPKAKITIVNAGSTSSTPAPVSPKSPTADGIKKKKPPLPAGWKKVKDPNSGHSYYYHTKTKKTQWKRPTEETDPTA